MTTPQNPSGPQQPWGGQQPSSSPPPYSPGGYNPQQQTPSYGGQQGYSSQQGYGQGQPPYGGGQPPYSSPGSGGGITKMILIISVVVALLVGLGGGIGLGLLIGGGDDDSSSATDGNDGGDTTEDPTEDPTEEPTEDPTPEPVDPPEPPDPGEDPTGPSQVVEGVTVEGWEISDVTLSSDFIDDFEGNFSVTNTGSDAKENAFEMTIKSGSRTVATISCGDYSSVEPGDSADAQCITSEDYTDDFDSVTLTYEGFS